MVLRYKELLPNFDRAHEMVNRCMHDLAGDDIERFKRITTQFRILDYRDIYIADEMDNEEYGYILKCLMTVGLFPNEAEEIPSGQ